MFVTSEQGAAAEATGSTHAAIIEKAVCAVTAWFPRLHALVVGPGLGRDPLMLECVAQVVQHARTAGLPVVLDGDGVFLLGQRPTLLAGYGRGVVTPNVREFARLQAALGLDEDVGTQGGGATVALARALGGVTVLRKGATDEISNGAFLLTMPQSCELAAAPPRRCGGQGDVLAGTTGVFLAWAARAGRLDDCAASAPVSPPPAVVDPIDIMCNDAARVKSLMSSPGVAVMLAALGGSVVTRLAAASAFAQHRRSMTTPDLIANLGASFENLFPVDVDALTATTPSSSAL